MSDARRTASASARRRRYDALKRAFDLLTAIALLVLLAPLLLGVAVAVLLADGTPVLFRQQRLGREGRPFTLFKFRTMRRAAGPWDPSRDHARMTTVGRMLRRWSLDELPQLWCVVRGDMSLVGPRPLPVEYGPRYTPAQFRRHDVLPGITGWAQVNGRNATTWDERFRQDVWYVDHRSLALDLRILARTAVAAVSGHGVSKGEAVTMPEFRGG